MKALLAALALATSVTGIGVASSASAQPPGYSQRHDRDWRDDRRRHWRDDRRAERRWHHGRHWRGGHGWRDNRRCRWVWRHHRQVRRCW